MIRPLLPEHIAAVLDLVVAAGMFAADEVGLVEELLTGDVEGGVGVVDDEGGVLGVAYYQPEHGADAVYDLTMIAVAPAHQGQGRGAALLRHVEEDLRGRGQRLLLVDTSASPQYDLTRAFYRRCGYDEEARIRDYWADGDDLVVFRKALAAT